MKKIICLLFLMWALGPGTSLVRAQTLEVSSFDLSPTASVSATPVPTKVEEAKGNITEPGSEEASYRLGAVLNKQDVGRWNGFNTMKIIVRLAVERGVSANTIVIMLLLPLIATLVAVLHYVFGLSGYGIFTPTMVAMTFLATGILGGLSLFALILIISIAGGLFMKKLRLHFWPARSINLLLISLGTFGMMIVSSYFGAINLTKISIFPILFMIVLAEDFVRTQLVKSRKEAKKLTLGTLVLAICGALMMNIRTVQEMVLLNPEIVILLVLVINIWVGNYSGIRLSELSRFKKAIRDQSKPIRNK